MAATLDSSAPSWMPWSPVIRPLTYRIRVKRWLRTTSPGPPNKLGSPPRSSTLLAPIVPENGSRAVISQKPVDHVQGCSLDEIGRVGVLR